MSSIAAQVEPALVDINTDFGYQQAQGAGTGIVLTPTGEILTNNHVIDGATSISVTDLGNGRTYGASVVGYDATHDVAVLQLQGASGLRTATLGDSSAAQVGQSVVAIGNAGGQGTPTASPGKITALNQDITASDDLDGASEQLSGLIQVDADIQAGDSGGSLVDSAGQVIGIDTAASSGYSLQSMSTDGYAIPIDQALSIAGQIESGQGSSTVHVGPTAFLGLLISSSSPGANGSGSRSFRFGTGGSGPGGAVVSDVVPGSPAAASGLTQGDVITSLGGDAVANASDLSRALTGDHPGQTVMIGWSDSSGAAHSASVQLASGPPA